MFLKRANASLSFPPPIYKPSMEEARWGAVSLRNACPSAQHSGQMLAFEGKTRSHSRAFTISLTGSSCCPAVYSAGPVAIAIVTNVCIEPNRDCLAARTRNRAISAALIFYSHCLKPPLFRHRTKKCLNRCEEAVVISRAWSLSPPRAGQSCPACALSFPAHRPDVPGKGGTPRR